MHTFSSQVILNAFIVQYIVLILNVCKVILLKSFIFVTKYLSSKTMHTLI